MLPSLGTLARSHSLNLASEDILKVGMWMYTHFSFHPGHILDSSCSMFTAYFSRKADEEPSTRGTRRRSIQIIDDGLTHCQRKWFEEESYPAGIS
jgi:hypothetical protein